MSDAVLIAKPPVRWGLPAVFGVFGAPFVALAVLLLRQGRLGSGVFLLLFGLLFFAFAAFVAFSPKPKVRLTPERIGFGGDENWREVDWEQLVALLSEEHVVELGAGTTRVLFRRHHICLIDGTRFTFLGAWSDSERVAGSLQRARFEPDAQLDRSELAVIAADGRTISARERPDPAMALGVARRPLERWLDAVAAVLRERGDSSTIDRRMLQAHGEKGTLELFSMARATIRADEAEWPSGIGAYLEKVKRSQDEFAAFRESARSFEVARSSLRLQLHTVDRLTDENIVSDKLGEDFRIVLVAELPSSEATLDAALVKSWGREHDEVMSIARDNLAACPPPERSAAADGGALAGVLAFRGDDFCAARVLVLEKLVELERDLGAIIALPSQTAMIVLPVRSMAETMSLLDGSMAMLARSIHAGAPRPLSPELYWWRSARSPALTLIRQLANAAGGITYALPDELTGLLTGRIARA